MMFFIDGYPTTYKQGYQKKKQSSYLLGGEAKKAHRKFQFSEIILLSQVKQPLCLLGFVLKGCSLDSLRYYKSVKYRLKSHRKSSLVKNPIDEAD